jgi:hypothetical protein
MGRLFIGAQMKLLLGTILILLFSCQLLAAEPERFIDKVKLPSGELVVVAEGEFEARSIGSFSVRVYEPASQPDETTFFVSGLINFRDGTIEKVVLSDLNKDLTEEIIVTARSVGTGSYISAYAFAYSNSKLIFLTSIEGLPPDADSLAALRDELK